MCIFVHADKLTSLTLLHNTPFSVGFISIFAQIIDVALTFSRRSHNGRATGLVGGYLKSAESYNGFRPIFCGARAFGRRTIGRGHLAADSWTRLFGSKDNWQQAQLNADIRT